MAEEFKSFVDSFNQEVDAVITKQTAQLEQYRSTRNAAIALKDPIDFSFGNNKFSTVGDLFKYVYPNEEGGVQNLPFDQIGSQIIVLLSGSDASDLTKKSQDALNKTWGASTRLTNALKVKETGAQAYVDSLSLELNRAIANRNLNKKDISQEDFERVVQSLNANIPYGNLSLLYEPLISSPTPLAGPAPAAINPATEEPSVSTSPQINPIAPTAEGQTSGSAINPPETLSLPAESVERAGGTVSETRPELPNEEQSTQSQAISINLAQTETPASSIERPGAATEVSPTVSPISSSTTNETNVTTGGSTAINEIISETNVSEIGGETTTNTTNTAINSFVNELVSSSDQFSQFLKPEFLSSSAGPLEKTMGSSAALSEKETVSSTINSLASELTLGQTLGSVIEKSATSSATSNTINENQTKIKDTSALKEKMTSAFISSYFGINEGAASSEQANLSSEVASSSSASPGLPKEINEGVEVAKTAPTFSEKIQANSSETQLAPATSIVSTTTMPAESASTGVVQVQESMEKNQPAAQSEQPAAGAQSNLILLEKRLSRIEFLLSQPLEVKIID